MPTGRAGIKRLSGRYRFKDRLWELNCGILGLGLSVGASFVITGALKNAIGKPRPDLISRYADSLAHFFLTQLIKYSCHVVDDRIDRSAPYLLQTVAICNQPNVYELNDGFKSFPSGHSSCTLKLLPFMLHFTD
jgi:diacylglycerol diphosphate phosphatase/phosphatidate phosphatase